MLVRWTLVIYAPTTKNAQQSVHLTLGILRQSQAVFYASAFFRPSVMLCERTPLENKNRETSITTCFPVYLFTCLLIPTTSPTRPPSCSRHRSRPARTSLSECPHRLRQESARVLRSRQQIIS